MSRENSKLIERAGALLDQRKISRGASNAENERPGQPPALDARVRSEFEARPQPIPSSIDESEDVHPAGILNTIARRKFTLIGTTLLLLTAAVAAIFSMKPLYLAEAAVLVGNREPSVTRIQLKIEGETARLLPDPETVQTEVEILRSRALGAEVANSLKLWEHAEFNPSIHPSTHRGALETVLAWIAAQYAHARELAGGFSLGATEESRRLDITAAAGDSIDKENTAVDILLSKLTVAVKTNSRVIAVQFEGRDPQLAAAVVNTLVDFYIANQVAATSLAVQDATQWLEQTVAKLRERVTESDQVFEQFRAGFESRARRDFLDRKMADASSQLATAELARKDAETRLMQLKSVLGKDVTDVATSEVANSPVMQSLRQKAADLKGQLAQLSATLGDSHPKLGAIKAGIAKVNEEMRAEIARLVKSLEGDVRVATMKEESLRQSLSAARDEISGSSGGQMKLNSLRAEAASNRAVLEAFLTRLNEANKASAKPLQRADAEIVSHASVPKLPAKPRTTMLLAIAAVAATMMGIGITVAWEKTDGTRTFRSGEQIELATGIRTLALVPLTYNKKKPQDEVLASQGSFYGEAIRSLYITLLRQQRFKIVLVTSARPGEGKTTLATSLALMATKAGRKVLLIDADLCTGGASQALGLAGHEGFAEMIAGAGQHSEVVATVGLVPNFHFLACGTRSNAMAARCALERTLELFRRFREEYDLVIIDSPPVLAVADAMALSNHADAILLAVRWGVTPRAAVKLSQKRLFGSGNDGSGTGIVLTMVNPRLHSRYGFGDSAFYTKELRSYHRITSGSGSRGPLDAGGSSRCPSLIKI
jgi:capsular exopolysaccharide synthesis family protein